MDNLSIIKEIIKEQSLIIGEELAKNRAVASGVVRYNSEKIDDVYLISDNQSAVTIIISSFEEVFGTASTQVCNNVLKRIQHV